MSSWSDAIPWAVRPARWMSCCRTDLKRCFLLQAVPFRSWFWQLNKPQYPPVSSLTIDPRCARRHAHLSHRLPRMTRVTGPRFHRTPPVVSLKEETSAVRATYLDGRTSGVDRLILGFFLPFVLRPSQSSLGGVQGISGIRYLTARSLECGSPVLGLSGERSFQRCGMARVSSFGADPGLIQRGNSQTGSICIEAGLLLHGRGDGHQTVNE